MLHEATEGVLRRALASKVAVAVHGYDAGSLEVNSDDFQTIKVQLLALGIIQESERKRSASDRSAYWTLTPYGRHYTMTLKAIRSSHAALEALARRGVVDKPCDDDAR